MQICKRYQRGEGPYVPQNPVRWVKTTGKDDKNLTAPTLCINATDYSILLVIKNIYSFVYDLK